MAETAPRVPDLDEIKARADAATEGPWFVEKVGDVGDKAAVIACVRWRGYVNNATFDEDFDTAEFIAHARTDIPALLTHIEGLEYQLRRTTPRLKDRIDRPTQPERPAPLPNPTTPSI